MVRIDLTIPSLGGKFADIRDNLPGDSFNWSWVRPLSQVNFLAIHHSGGPDTQTPTDIANYHVSNNGWGGIGYHFLIGKDGIVYYVGDIGSARANVANLNEQVIGICLVGNFMGGKEPTLEQLDSTQKLCDFFIREYPDLSNVTSWEAVRGHKELPNQATTCPGDSWNLWKGKLFGASSLQNTAASESEDSGYLKSQVDNLQTSLASVNQQVISLQEAGAEKDRLINELKFRLTVSVRQQTEAGEQSESEEKLSILGFLILLYKFIFPPRKEALA